MDQELLRPLKRRVERSSDSILLGTRVGSLVESLDRVDVVLDGQPGSQERSFDRVLVAIGRSPNTERLGLETTKARLPDDLYAERHPTPDDVLLLVEVAASSVEPDRRVKVPLYSRHSVREVWLVDLEQDTVTAYAEPTPSGYRTARVFRRGEHLAPSAFPDRALAVTDLLPG